MNGGQETGQIRSAERCLAAALAQKDMRTAAALLRCAAKYLEGAADADERSVMVVFRGMAGVGAPAPAIP